MKKIVSTYQKAYSGLSPATWWLSLVMLINRSGTMVIPFMTLYLTQKLNYSLAQAGWIMALFGAGAVCGGLLGGQLISKFGFHKIQLITLIGGGLLFLVLGQMKEYAWICVFAFSLSLVNDMFRPANSAAIAHYSKSENRTRSFSLNRLAINLGWAFGGAIGGFVASKNYDLLFWIDGLTNIGAAILLKFMLQPYSSVSEKKDLNNKNNSSTKRPLQDRTFLAFLFLTFLFAVCFFQLFSTLPVFYRKELKLSETVIGWTMSLNGLIICFLEMIVIHRLEQKGKMLLYIMIGLWLIAASFLILNLHLSVIFVALLSVVLMSFGEILSMPFMNTFWVTRTNDNNRGSYAGLYTVAWSVAQIIGPGAGAQLAQNYGFQTLWICIASICIFGGIGFRFLENGKQLN